MKNSIFSIIILILSFINTIAQNQKSTEISYSIDYYKKLFQQIDENLKKEDYKLNGDSLSVYFNSIKNLDIKDVQTIDFIVAKAVKYSLKLIKIKDDSNVEKIYDMFIFQNKAKVNQEDFCTIQREVTIYQAFNIFSKGDYQNLYYFLKSRINEYAGEEWFNDELRLSLSQSIYNLSSSDSNNFVILSMIDSVIETKKFKDDFLCSLYSYKMLLYSHIINEIEKNDFKTEVPDIREFIDTAVHNCPNKKKFKIFTAMYYHELTIEQLKHENTAKAKEFINKGLSIEPESAILKEDLRKLEENEKKK